MWNPLGGGSLSTIGLPARLNPTVLLVHHVSILATERQLYPVHLNHRQSENRPIHGVFGLISLSDVVGLTVYKTTLKQHDCSAIRRWCMNRGSTKEINVLCFSALKRKI